MPNPFTDACSCSKQKADSKVKVSLLSFVHFCPMTRYVALRCYNNISYKAGNNTAPDISTTNILTELRGHVAEENPPTITAQFKIHQSDT